jgi:hypothetical protein
MGRAATHDVFSGADRRSGCSTASRSSGSMRWTKTVKRSAARSTGMCSRSSHEGRDAGALIQADWLEQGGQQGRREPARCRRGRERFRWRRTISSDAVPRRWHQGSSPIQSDLDVSVRRGAVPNIWLRRRNPQQRDLAGDQVLSPRTARGRSPRRPRVDGLAFAEPSGIDSSSAVVNNAVEHEHDSAGRRKIASYEPARTFGRTLGEAGGRGRGRASIQADTRRDRPRVRRDDRVCRSLRSIDRRGARSRTRIVGT